jgi:hypothetical protein
VPESLRLNILKALSDHLAGTPLAGGKTLGEASVYRGKLLFGAEMKLPALSVLEAPRQDDGIPGAEKGVKRSEGWALLVQGWVPDDKRNPTDPAYEFCARVEQRMSMLVDEANGQPVYPDIYRLGKLPNGRYRIAGLTWAPPVVRPPQQGVSDKAFFYLPVTLSVAIDIREPFVTAG